MQNTKNYVFTIDDNIRFIKELTYGDYQTAFSHPYLKLLKSFHDRYGAKIQLNVFYQADGFSLSDATDRFNEEFTKNSDWLKMSFHSKMRNYARIKIRDITKFTTIV